MSILFFPKHHKQNHPKMIMLDSTNADNHSITATKNILVLTLRYKTGLRVTLTQCRRGKMFGKWT